MKISYKTILKKRTYRRLLFANMINRLGDSIDTLAFSWLVYAFTGEGKWAALVFAVNKVPSVIFLPLAGAYVEKKIKKNIIIVCDLIRALLVTALLACMLTKTISLVILLAFSFLISLAEAFRIPAGVSFITQLLEEEELSYGISLNVLVSMLSGVAGMGIAGLLISCLSVTAAFGIDVTTFVISILLITSIAHSECIAKDMLNENSFTIFKEGLRYIKERKVLASVILFAVFANGIMAPLDSLQTPIVVDIFKQDAEYLSLLNIGLTVGILLGGAVYPVMQNKVKSKILFLFSYLYIMGLYILTAVMYSSEIAAVGIWYYVVIACYLLYGVFAGFLTTGLGIALMAHTEQEYMSRINTIFTAMGEAIVPLASAVTGLLLNFLNIEKIFLLVPISSLIFLAGCCVKRSKQ